MHILYSSQVADSDLNPEQREFLENLRSEHRTVSNNTSSSRRSLLKKLGVSAMAGATLPGIAATASASSVSTGQRSERGIEDAQDWVTAFFDKGAEEVLGYYADDFVWEDIQFMQTITTKEELYKAFVVFNNSGPDSAFGVHRFEVLRYDGGPAGSNKATVRESKAVPETWTEEEFRPYERDILLGSDLDYDEWGYLQWVWKAQHNSDFFGIPAAGKSTTSRGVTFQCYKKGKIVRCQTFWNFRDFAMQLGVIPWPDGAWRNNPELES
tara:strand:+ start:36085 stop:36888 length:804 start_codon:yes stop_codon:yes gene_type:complete